MRILLLEDDLPTADSMVRAVATRGWKVVLFVTVDDAEKYVTSQKWTEGLPFDVAVLDYNVRGRKGTELLPLPFPACVYSGLPDDVPECGVPVFSKGHPAAVLDFLARVQDDLGEGGDRATS